jgi:transposase-like protein
VLSLDTTYLLSYQRPMATLDPESRYTLADFHEDFPDDSACLEWLKNHLYPTGIYCPKCARPTRHHRVKGRKSYSCRYCGRHVHPTADTIFHKSATSLKLWFYAVFLMGHARSRLSVAQLQRELGVTYKTAWRMLRHIRLALQDDVGIQQRTTEDALTPLTGKPQRLARAPRRSVSSTSPSVSIARYSDLKHSERGEFVRGQFLRSS